MDPEKIKNVLYAYKWENMPLEEAMSKLDGKSKTKKGKRIYSVEDMTPGTIHELINTNEDFSLKYKVKKVTSISNGTDRFQFHLKYSNPIGSRFVNDLDIHMEIQLSDPEWELWEY